MSIDKKEIIGEITRLKKEYNAVIAAHNYQKDEVQDIADVVGDSFALSRYCANNPADVVVFCGVHFMAESAKILSPQKTVLLPELDAGCPMADMVDPKDLREKKLALPDAGVVCYINSSAEVKAESDICCTSSNAVKVVKAMPEKKIIFVPDCNLGSYVSANVPEKEIILWQGFCPTHHNVHLKEIHMAKDAQPDAVFLVHPECRPEVISMADFVGSTKQIIDYVQNSDKNKFIIGTEMGVLYSLKKQNPKKQFFLVSPSLICKNMKKISLESIYTALKDMKYKIDVNEKIRIKAKLCLDRMLKIS